MNRRLPEASRDDSARSAIDEEALLRSALQDSGGLLASSLREEERRRRMRRKFVVTLIGGGIVMGTVAIAAFAGWLTLVAPPPATQAEPAKAEANKVDREEWVTRLVGLRDHMQTAFGVGPDLTLVDPDQGLEIVREAWPKITRTEVKTGLLKTFDFSKALPAKHPKVLQVLDLGMNDKNPKVREYAAGYVEEFAGKNFSHDPKGYAEWYGKNGDKDPNELLKAARKDGIPEKSGQASQASGAGTKESTASLNTKGWKAFFSGDYDSATKSFQQILQVNPNHPAAMNGLGFCLLNQGQAAEAQPYFEKLLKATPNAPGAMNGLARCLKDQGKTDEAIKIWERAYKRDPAPDDIAAGLSEAYFEQKEFAKAAPILEQLVKAHPEDEKLRSMLETARNGTQSK